MTYLRYKVSTANAKKFSLFRLRQIQLKAAIFYGVTSRKKFRFIQHLTLNAMKFRALSMLKLELSLALVLFKLNLFDNIYFSKNFIRIGGCFIDNRLIIYPFYSLNLFEVLSIKRKFFKKIFNIFFNKMFFFSFTALKFN
jgi:hypothetical protein